MNALLRHMAARLWITVLAGVLLGMTVLPWWQQIMGPDYLVLPASIVLLFCFFSSGWAMNRAGAAFLRRKLKESAAWERAGMRRDAAAAFEQALGLYDSFWLSPLRRRALSGRLSARLVRFLLTRPRPTETDRRHVADYLIKHPRDAAVVEAWLDLALSQDRPLPREHEAAAVVADAGLDNARIQEQLFRFFMVNGRADFYALQTYRRYWRRHQPLDTGLLLPVARILLNEERLDIWCVELYIQAYKAGEKRCLEGIVAAAHLLTPDEWSRGVLLEAAQIARQAPPERQKAITAGLPSKPTRNPRVRGPRVRTAEGPFSLSALIRALTAKTTRVGKTLYSVTETWARMWRGSSVLRTGAIATSVTLALVVVGVGFWRARELKKTPETISAPLPVDEIVPIGIDPFTIQVAAYMKSEDARRFVDKLKQQGLDAFWTDAVSAQRKWYQVKVSHFATRAQAQEYGEQLKAKGLIEDFYVANYEPQALSAPKSE